MKKYTLRPLPHPSRSLCIEDVKRAPDGTQITINEETRTVEQNSVMWPYLRAISNQKDWVVNNGVTKMTPEEWKDVLTAAFHQEEPRMAVGISGGLIMLGHRTSNFSKKEWGEWMEFLKCFCAQNSIKVLEDFDVR